MIEKEKLIDMDSSELILRKIVDLKNKYEEKIKKLEEDHKNEIKKIENKINSFVTKHGYNSLEELKVLDNHKRYIGAELNELGYVKSVSLIDSFFDQTTIPDNLSMGYYKIKNNELVLDEAMRARLWGD